MDRFGDYTLLEKIASGGMADIFRAAKVGARGFRKYFAIKRILSHISEDKAIQDMFVKEAHILSTANHANVVQIYELGEVKGQYFIAMNYIEGKDLRSFLDSAYENGYMVPLEITLYIFSCITEGLEYVHQLTDNNGQCINIVHRDINPNNILVSYNGEVKIIDFGIVKSDVDTEKTKFGVIKGKLSYLSPEQLEGKKIDQRTDIFAAGIVLYEMLARKRLFSGKTESEIFNSLINLDLVKEIDLLPVTPAIAAILNKLLAKDPAKRYATMSEIKEDLYGLITSENLQVSRLQLRHALQGLFIEDIADEARKKNYFDQLLSEGGTADRYSDVTEKILVSAKGTTAAISKRESQPFGDQAEVSAPFEMDEEQKTRILRPEGPLSEREPVVEDATQVLMQGENQKDPKTTMLQNTDFPAAQEERKVSKGGTRKNRRMLAVSFFAGILVTFGLLFFFTRKEHMNIWLYLQDIFRNDTVHQEVTETKDPVQLPDLGLSGVLSVSGTPPGQTVYVNGVAQGELPRTITLEPGFYEVECQLDGWRPYQAGVKVRKGKTLNIICDLEVSR